MDRSFEGPWSTKAGVLYAHAPAWALERVVALRVSLDDSTPVRVSDCHCAGHRAGVTGTVIGAIGPAARGE